LAQGEDGARAAKRLPLAAVTLAMGNNERVKLIEEGGLGGKSARKHRAHLGIGFATMEMAETVKEPAGIGIDDKGRMPAGIEKNGIGGLVTDAGLRQQLSSHQLHRPVKADREGAGIIDLKKSDKRLEPGSLLTKKSGRTYQCLQRVPLEST